MWHQLQQDMYRVGQTARERAEARGAAKGRAKAEASKRGVSFNAPAIQVDDVTIDDVREVIATNALAQLDEDTPGGAMMHSWADSGFSMDEEDIIQAIGDGAKKSKNRAVRMAAGSATAMGSSAASACSASGVGAAFTPVCGAFGAITGLLSGVGAAHFMNLNEAGQALEDAWYGANRVLAEGIRAVQAAYAEAGQGSLSDEEAACLIVEAMEATGSDMADRIAGPYQGRGYRAPCGIPGRICTSAFEEVRTAQFKHPFPALPEGESWPNYFTFERWWMLRNRAWKNGKGKYGNCIDPGDMKNNAAHQGKVSTRRKRAKRFRDLADTIFEAVQIVIATMVNLRDARAEVIDQSRAAAREEAEARGAAKGRAKAKAMKKKSSGGGLVTAAAAGAAGLGLLAALGAFA